VETPGTGKMDWGAAHQRAVEELHAETAKLGELLPQVGHLVQESREYLAGGQKELIRLVREQHDADRRAERKRVALELMAAYDAVRALRREVRSSRGHTIINAVAVVLARQFMSVALCLRQALGALGVEVRDRAEPFDPALDMIAKTEPVNDPAYDRKIIRVEAAGYRWLDGTGILRQRQVAVGQYTKPT
jgi:hypothetical protein